MRILAVIGFSLIVCGCSDVDLFGDAWNAETTPAETVSRTAENDRSIAVQSPASPANQSLPQSATEPPAVSAARSRPASAATSARCTLLARQRASDAAFQGEDPDTQGAVYNTTYRDCVAWDAAHRS
jgi:hypothetical protein